MDRASSSSSDNGDEIYDAPWTLNDFNIGKPLGSGRFGRVYLAKEKRSPYKLLLAIKILMKSTLTEHDAEINFQREVEIQSKLKHPNIIRFFGWFHDDKRIYLILEYACGGSVYKKLEQKGSFDNQLSATYIYQVTKALIYIHSMGVIHRDLKPENLLIGNLDEIKLADFGWACEYSEELSDKSDNSLAGTLDYLSPEIIEGHKYDKKVDNWCLGVLCYEFLTGKAPFEQRSSDKTLDSILNVKFKFPKSIVRSARQLINRLLVKDPNNRLDLEEVFESKWIQEYANTDDSYSQYYEYDRESLESRE